MKRAPPTFQPDNRTRLRRMNAWILRAQAFRRADAEGPALVENPHTENTVDIGIHAQFAFWWIAFEAGYAREGPEGEALGTREQMKSFIHRAMLLKPEIRMDSWPGTLSEWEESAKALINLPPASQWYWRESRAGRSWEGKFQKEADAEVANLRRAASGHHEAVPRALKFLLVKRLYVVRNQVIHGGSSLASSYGRPQVELSVQLLSAFVPKFRNTILFHPEVDWGPVPYPRREPEDKWPVG